MTPQYPRLSIVVPCRNERAFIESFLDSVLAQTYPADRYEIIVADGMSDDGTYEILERLQARIPNLRVIVNQGKTVPYALNAAIAASDGDVIVRLDAHARYPANYLESVVGGLDRYRADNVGVGWITEPGAETLEAEVIARAISNPFGVGNAVFRTGTKEPIETDTVPFGCFRRSVVERIGLFDEELTRNQDDEFNGRMVRHGMKIVLLPDPKITYFARPRYAQMRRMYYEYGLFKPLVLKKLGRPATIRQLVPPAFVLTLAVLLAASLWQPQALWLLALLLAAYGTGALRYALKERRRGASWRAVLRMPWAFFQVHVAYGIGYWHGVLKVLTGSRFGAPPPNRR